MAQTKKSHRGLIIGLIVFVLIIVAGYLAYQQFSNGTLQTPLQLSSSKTIEAPVLAEDLTQKALITNKDGGVIRAIDAAGNVTILKVPKGAVAEDVEISVTPFEVSQTGLRQGVQITPEDIVFEKPVTLSFNWYLSEKKTFTKRPFVMQFNNESNTVALTPLQRALVVKNYLPALITSGGFFGVSDDSELEIVGAQEVLKESEDTLSLLNAGLTLAEYEKLSKSETVAMQKLADQVGTQEEPDLNELYLAVQFDSRNKNESAFSIPTAHAYGLTDGYLQFRCNYKDTTYEDAIIAMDTAAQLGYKDVEKTCRERAEKLLIERANLVDTEKNRPLIDAVEVLQQMQMLGLTDEGSAGAAVAERLHNDVQASLHKIAPDQIDAPDSGTVRDNRASTDPLLKHNSQLIQEMIGVQALRFIGIETFDEAGIKNFGEMAHRQISGLNMLADHLCDLDDIWPIFNEVKNQFDPTREYDKRCQKIESGQLMDVMDRWKVDVNEAAEGVDAVQKGQKPNDNAEDYSLLQSMLDALER